MDEKKRIIVLFSGGKDSFLTTCLLAEKGYKVSMVTFDNGAGLSGTNAKYGAERIIKKYGGEKAEFLGVFSIAGIWRTFVLPYRNMKPKKISDTYGELTASQFNCLTCRSAMYVWTILKAREMDVSYVADGARKNQGFVIELPCMTERFKKFFGEFGLNLLFPVLGLTSDWELKNLLLARGFVPKVIEPQCLLGVPLDETPDQEVQEATVSYFDQVIVPRARQLIDDIFPITAEEDYL
jgi:hypothetical protein